MRRVSKNPSKMLVNVKVLNERKKINQSPFLLLIIK